MKIPTLQELKQQFENDNRVIFKKEFVNNKEYTIVFLQNVGHDFWDLEYSLETRGHVFDSETGKCVSAAFNKFFNINELPRTHLETLDFDNSVWFDKCDGSMITGLCYLNEHEKEDVLFKTKKSFYSSVAIDANKNATDNVKKLANFFDSCNYTAIFEYTDRNWQIVLDYGDTPKFTLIAARNKRTGEYLKYDLLKQYAMTFDIDIIKKYDDMTIAKALEEIETIKDREGYVILLNDGNRVKLKFNWYRENHYVKTSIRERDIASMVLDETIDDIKSLISLSGEDIQPILDIENQVLSELNDIRTYVLKEAELVKNWDFAQVATKHKKNIYSKLIFDVLRDRTPDYNRFWKQYYLKEYSLKCVYNNKF